MRGGMIFCAFQSDGLDDIRAEPRPISALKNAMPCARSVRSALNTGGGRQEAMYESRGSRKDGTGIGISGGTTIAIVGGRGGVGRWVGKRLQAGRALVEQAGWAGLAVVEATESPLRHPQTAKPVQKVVSSFRSATGRDRR